MARVSRKSSPASATVAQAAPTKWEVVFHDEFLPEFRAFDPEVRLELAAAARAIELAGPKTGRPHVDTLNGSKHDNMKELRFKAHHGAEIWRAAFAFDPQRRAYVLVAGDKQGQDEAAFYRALIKVADKRFDAHLKKLAKAKKGSP
ncbi:MAG: type II toxin-antitoxin system RelE/ParE family toxin [Acidovorax sp.]|nr:type II toxin-antitoxin system RelE/ParE family toxin [Acidovorax sp.]MDZ7862935.1 type II toxin-antitoxin system RelE/ParE family toxin [Acidovorax sp.]